MPLRLCLLLACAGCALDRHATAPGEPLDQEPSAAEAGMSTAPPPAANPDGPSGELADAGQPYAPEDAGELDPPAQPGLDAATGMPEDAALLDAVDGADSAVADAAEPPSACMPGQPGPAAPDGACSPGGRGPDELYRPCAPGREPACAPCRGDGSPGPSIDAGGPPGRAPEGPGCNPPCEPCSEPEVESEE